MTLEAASDALVKHLKPSAGLTHIAEEMFRNIWALREGSRVERAKSKQGAIQTLDRKISTLMDRLIDTDSQTQLNRPPILGQDLA